MSFFKYKLKKVKIADLIGIQYKKDGEDINSGFYCFRFVQEVEKRFGRDFSIELLMHDSFFKQTFTPEYGDVVVFYDGRKRARHVGVYLEEDKVVHCDSFGSRVSRISELGYEKWRFYKWSK